MFVQMLKAKLHLATVTHSELHYDGSCAIDEELIKAAGLREFEAINIYNVNNGERFTTYVITAARGSGSISMNGAAARKAQVGDRVIIASYGYFTEAEADSFKPRLVYLDACNRIERTRCDIPIHVA